MRIPKKYGQGMAEKCPFCQKQVTTVNSQKIPVCQGHKTAILQDLKCVCGSYLDTKVGKYGVYFTCMRCGNLNLSKVLEYNRPVPGKKGVQARQTENRPAPEKQPEQGQGNDRPEKEVYIRSDDPDYFD